MLSICEAVSKAHISIAITEHPVLINNQNGSGKLHDCEFSRDISMTY